MKIKQVLVRAINYIIQGVPFVTANVHTVSHSNLLDSRVALITGGTSGIGLEIAKSFINAGAKVVITGRSEGRLLEAIDQIIEYTQKENSVKGLVLDNLATDTFEKKIKEAVSCYGHIDILVNNAGVLTHDTIAYEKEEKYDLVFDTNLKGPVFLSRIFGHYLIDNGIKGNILNVGSSSCLRPASTAYTLSKWGIRGLTMGLARMLASYGITVNGIAPGPTMTKMVKDYKKIDNLYLGSIPLGRFILPEEIANMAVILVSEMSRSIMGDMIYMTGGSGLLTYEDMSYRFKNEK